jgi:hypothetical protein
VRGKCQFVERAGCKLAAWHLQEKLVHKARNLFTILLLGGLEKITIPARNKVPGAAFGGKNVSFDTG